MRAYLNFKFIEDPDVVDIRSQGRKTSVGRIPRGEMYWRISPVDRLGVFVRVRKLFTMIVATAVVLQVKLQFVGRFKRADRALTTRFELLAEE